MLSKNVLKDIQSLSLKKHRDERRVFVAEGPKVVEELMQTAPGQIETIYAVEEWAKGKTFGNLQVVAEHELQILSGLKTANKAVAVVKQFSSSQPSDNGFVLYLDAVQDPGNFGTIVRIADWFGVKDVVCNKGCADLYNPKVVQATMASIGRVNVFYDEAESWLATVSSTVYAAALQGKPLSHFQKLTQGVLIIGNESKGIRKEFLALAKECITIQKRGEAESLNAAVATGIILSHLLQ
jgi:TrmH family RNA methyltransferase